MANFSDEPCEAFLSSFIILGQKTYGSRTYDDADLICGVNHLLFPIRIVTFQLDTFSDGDSGFNDRLIFRDLKVHCASYTGSRLASSLRVGFNVDADSRYTTTNRITIGILCGSGR